MCRKLKLGQSPQKGPCTKEETAPREVLITPAAVLQGDPAAGHEDGSNQGSGQNLDSPEETISSLLTNCCTQSSTCLTFRNLQQGHNLNFSFLIIKKVTLHFKLLLLTLTSLRNQKHFPGRHSNDMLQLLSSA